MLSTSLAENIAVGVRAADIPRSSDNNRNSVCRARGVPPPPPLKTSVYDWDSPSSFTGTVKRRPHSISPSSASSPSSPSSSSSPLSSSSSSCLTSPTTISISSSSNPDEDGTSASANNNKQQRQRVQRRQTFHQTTTRQTTTTAAAAASTLNKDPLQGIISKRSTTIQMMSSSGSKSNRDHQQQQRSGSSAQDKPSPPSSSSKLRQAKASSDRNANSPSTAATSPTDCNDEMRTIIETETGCGLKLGKVSQLKSPGNKIQQSRSLKKTSTATERGNGAGCATAASAELASPYAVVPATSFSGLDADFYSYQQQRQQQQHQLPTLPPPPRHHHLHNLYDPLRNSFEFTELFCDFPVVSYESTGINFSKSTQSSSGAIYQNEQPPTPPPISHMPSHLNTVAAAAASHLRFDESRSMSAPTTPSRGKVVLSKKERKELIKNSRSNGCGTGSTSSIASAATDQPVNENKQNPGISVSANSSPYKGRVHELKNCIAKIGSSRGLFSLTRNFSGGTKTLVDDRQSAAAAADQQQSTAAQPPETATRDIGDIAVKIKNLPVRQRKGGISHWENYCLFDPSVDFINEKTLQQQRDPQPENHLKDPLFSKSPDVDFDEELVDEIIYEDQTQETASSTFDHHNYFVIDPDDFEMEPPPAPTTPVTATTAVIGIPNPFTNEQLINAKLQQNSSNLSPSISLEKLLDKLNEDATIMTNSQDTTTGTGTTNSSSTATNSSSALVDSSTSTNSSGSTTSTGGGGGGGVGAPSSSQTTLQRTKKRLTFLNLSPFRLSGGGGSSRNNNSLRHRATNHSESIDSEIEAGAAGAAAAAGSIDNLPHRIIDNLLLDKDAELQFRNRTIPIESNYVLFNPGPVPSRNVQYKIRKPRPLSTHSDADSGFLSPCSPDELTKFNPAILVLQQCDSVQGYIEIYTDWANYYLERAKSKKKVTDLSADCRDGLLLADVIEAVTSFKVPDLVKKPKNQQQMYDNVDSCLNVLRQQAVGGLDTITTNDICAGRLKAVLALFFALSRFKQQAKQSKSLTGSIKAEIHQQPATANHVEKSLLNVSNSTTSPAAAAATTATTTANNKSGRNLVTTTSNANIVVTNRSSTNLSTQQQQQQLAQSLQNGNETMTNRQIPTAYSKANGGTAIPLPATVLVQRRCPPDKVRPLPPTPNHTPTIPGLGKNGADFNNGSRPGSPPTTNHTIQTIKSVSGNNNGLRQPTTAKNQLPSTGIAPPTTTVAASSAPNGPTKHSMLDKLKLFNREKQQQQQQQLQLQQQQQQQQQTATNNKSQVSKRTSSSSGFSSARSERSDSSLSLNDGHISQIKPPAVSVAANRNNKDSSGSKSSKQSKLLVAQKNSSSGKSKLDKKEKSPARSLNKDEDGLKSGHSSIGRGGQRSLPRASDQKSSKTSSRTSLTSRSESKSSLIMPPGKSLIPSAATAATSPCGSVGTTAIPKPVAAVKGTSKPQPQLHPDVGHKSNKMSGDVIKREKSDISSHHHISATSSSSSSPPHHHHNQHHQQQQQQNNLDPQQQTTQRNHQNHIIKPVALLPDSGNKTAPYYSNSISSNMSDSLTNSGNVSNNNCSPESNVTSYRPPSGESSPIYVTSPNSNRLASHAQKNPTISNRKTEFRELTQQQMLISQRQQQHNQQQQQQLLSPTTSSNKFHTIPSKVVGTIYEEEKPVSVMPMRPLLRGYNSHVTLPTRGARGHHYITDFCETDIGQGYCSDGDAFRVTSRIGHHSATSRFSDIDNGYLSEGSSGGTGGTGGGSHGKHFLSVMRARTQLPTTIEERTRNSRGSLDSIGTAPPSSGASAASSSTSGGGGGGTIDSSTKMDGSPNRSSSRNGRDNWTKMPEPLNGHHQGSHHHHHHHHQQQQQQQQMAALQHQAPTSPTSGRKEKSSPSHSRRAISGSGGSSSSSKQQQQQQQQSSSSPSSSSSSSGRTKGVPPSFGYVKRSNGTATATAEQQNIMMIHQGNANGGTIANSQAGRTAHVSAVPRSSSKMKVSGGTQTCHNDMQQKIPANSQHRSYSLTGPGATQLSQSIRERLSTGSHSLPKPGTDMHIFQHRISNRTSGKMIDGSLSDTQTYAEVKPEYHSTYAMWLKHSNTAGSRLSEGDSMENLQIGSPGMTRHGHKMIHRNSGNSNGVGGGGGGVVVGGGNNGNCNTGIDSPYIQSPRLNRSNSIRSTKSEKMYPSMLSRGPDVEIEPYYCLPVGTLPPGGGGQNGIGVGVGVGHHLVGGHHPHANTMPGTGIGSGCGPVAWSQPTSPTPLNRGFAGTLSPTHGSGGVVGTTGGGIGAGVGGVTGGVGHGVGLVGAATALSTGGCHRLTYPKKNDEVHGSAASLLSGGSSLYGSAEERQANEIRRLKRELIDAREQVMSLSSQLSTNAHVVAAFEQSLSNMTSRLQQLTATAERKDGELTDMRQTIELLRKQSIQAGLTTAHMQSMGGGQNQNDLLGGKPSPPLPPSSGLNMMSRVQQQQQQQHQQGHHHHHHHTINGNANANDTMQRHHSSDSMCSLNSISSGCSAHDKKKKKGWLRSSFTKAFSRNAKISKTNRHAAGGGGNSSANVSSSGSGHNGTSNSNSDPHNSTLGSIGSSSGGGNQHHHNGLLHIGEGCGSGSGGSGGLASLATQPAPSQTSPTKSSPAKTVTLIENAKPIDAIDHEDHHIVEDLKKQLREKDLVLTDIRLEALSSASQLENLKDTVMKMRAEMISLKQNNERLQKLVTSRSLAGSEASLGNAISPNGSIGESRRYSLADGNSRPPMELPKRLEEEVEEENIPPAPAPEPPPPPLSPTTHIDLTPPPPAIEPHSMPSPTHMATAVEEIPDITDGKKLAIACYLGQPESFPKYCEEILETDEFYRSTTNGIASGPDGKDSNSFDERKQFPTATLNEFVIAYTYISGKTTWQNLDYIVRKTFKDYVSRIDPGTNLGLNTDSITSYHLGEAKRGPEMGFPELLPCGYIIGNVRTLYICLQGVGSLAFDSLIPRSIVHRYISLLTEHRRLILCGPSGTGKSYLSRRLAEFLVARSGRGNPSEAIATFNVDHKSSKELRQYLGHVAEQASIANGASELPSVIILDNLHHASALGDVFSCLLSAGPAAKLPCIIGTMSQATCNTTNLQLHHNFRWVLTANHMEPVKGFLGRFLRRRLFQLELQTQNHQPELSTVLAWLPTVWQHINRFLEIHSSSDVTIGPRLFLSCPLDLKDSQVWFTDIWNYHLSPYLIEAVREGVQLYGRRGGAWNDPSVFIRNSYPWPYGPDSVPPLRQINAEDVGLEGITTTNNDAQDPLLNMLMRLQEAANYSENQDQESDCASLDSNITPDSSAGAE